MTTCKHCGKRRENHYEKIDGRVCCNPNGKGTVFEPSTEGTQPRCEPVPCPGCGSPIFIRENNTVVAHYNRHGDKCFMNEKQADDINAQKCLNPAPAAQTWEGHEFVAPDEWHGRWGCKVCAYSEDMHDVPAPVAQVDAGKYDFAKVRSQHFTEIAEEYEPAVAQTELPSVPQAELKIPDSRLREMVSGMDGLTPGDCADTKEIDAMVPELISLRERIARLEAREAELKAEIAKMQMDNVIDYKAACEQHAANYEALERSHKALLQALIQIRDDHCGMGELEPETISTACEAIAAAEKL